MAPEGGGCFAGMAPRPGSRRKHAPRPRSNWHRLLRLASGALALLSLVRAAAPSFAPGTSVATPRRCRSKISCAAGDGDDSWKKDPFDERWKGRKFDWFFTQQDDDIKLESLPRPGFLPPEFWEVFYERGVFLAIIQGALLVGGLIAIFQYLPMILNGLILSLAGKSG
mmetsp:Transcript_124852/g.364646  ORF Transcript_124852/g.364646 Transcript_124852/m.364646 type:complete len:168 (+) Transcript_124852:21-524(+)